MSSHHPLGGIDEYGWIKASRSLFSSRRRGEQVRNYDYYHYLCLLELPPEMRKAAFALRAFNVETARAMDVASDPKIGLMRLLWWQETIDKLYTKKPINHSTAQALSWAISEHNISKPWLKRSVEARIRDAQREVEDQQQRIMQLHTSVKPVVLSCY
ncbi:hypothetical protein EUTSA_v10022385mg [Eutrema salsugineum]|uniref:Uncharacterized protein n=1 Tax=Eutrema salsugineum TaxID=72664 RepID=V4M5U7_EUTSA|nr:hypothetical protein EUTSA_v10022385mg [Eutrema salsugineum]